MALYSDLVLKLSATVAEDGGSVLIEDVTGTYPESPGGYTAEDGTATSTRPKESEVAKFLMYQTFPIDGINNQNIPDGQGWTTPRTFGLLNGLGEPDSDKVYQFVFMVTELPLKQTWSELVVDADVSGDPWTWLVNYFSDDAFDNYVQIGQLAVPVTITSGNCVYDALRRFNNAQMGGSRNCDPTEYATKKALMQGVYSTAAIANSLEINSVAGNQSYTDSQTILDQLNAYCLLEDCKCNCE